MFDHTPPQLTTPEPTSAQPLAMTELETSSPAPSTGPSRPLLSGSGGLTHALRNVKVKLVVCVGSVELTVGELLEARAQQVIRLDRAVEQPVEVLLEGQVVARGTLVAVDERFAVRITEAPVGFDLATAPGQDGGR